MRINRAKLEEKIRIAEELIKRKARRNYYEYVKYVHPDYEYTKHGEFICNIIQGALDKRDQMVKGTIPQETQYIMLSVPPRHGKSMHVTETLPSYVMSKYERYKVVIAAYSSTLANDFARANTDKLKEYKVFNTEVVTDNQERTILSNKSECVKAGVLGGITGKGANLFIIDDPIKTYEDAKSENHREKIWREWISSFSTRAEPPAIYIVIMTRWHEDDLCGRLLNSEYADPLPWKVINLPLEAEENDVLGRKPGEPLWDRYGYDFIEIRKRYPEDFNALYQGRPTSQEGNMFKRHHWRYYNKKELFIGKLPSMVLSVDATFKGGKNSDNVAIHVWAKLKANYYLIDITKAKMDFSTTLVAIRNMLSKYPNITYKFVEDKANGSAIINVLNKEIGGFIGVNPQGGKESRAQAILPYVMAGNVFLPRGESFVNEFIEECASFPNGAHDDDVDAFTQALNQMIYSNNYIEFDNRTLEENFFSRSDTDNGGYGSFSY